MILFVPDSWVLLLAKREGYITAEQYDGAIMAYVDLAFVPDVRTVAKAVSALAHLAKEAGR